MVADTSGCSNSCCYIIGSNIVYQQKISKLIRVWMNLNCLWKVGSEWLQIHIIKILEFSSLKKKIRF